MCSPDEHCSHEVDSVAGEWISPPADEGRIGFPDRFDQLLADVCLDASLIDDAETLRWSFLEWFTKYLRDEVQPVQLAWEAAGLNTAALYGSLTQQIHTLTDDLARSAGVPTERRWRGPLCPGDKWSVQ